MDDFKKALGILEKAKQGGLFGPKILGVTPSGKAVDTAEHSPKSFSESHKDWSLDDFRHGSLIHSREAKKHGQVYDDSARAQKPDKAALGKLNFHDKMSRLYGSIAAAHRATNARQDVYKLTVPEAKFRMDQDAYNNFKKALGILSKSRQGGLFEKPVRVLGTTQSGKPILESFPNPQAFLKHHKDWNMKDHADAWRTHTSLEDKFQEERNEMPRSTSYATLKNHSDQIVHHLGYKLLHDELSNRHYRDNVNQRKYTPTSDEIHSLLHHRIGGTWGAPDE